METQGAPPQLPAQKATAGVAWFVFGIVLIFVAAAVQLRLQGRVWWCECGQPTLWWGDIWSSHNSQHLADPYSITHVSHGLLLWWLFAWLTPHMAATRRVLIALLIEAGWEVIENTSWVINRYRDGTISLDYFGDSIANSLGDIASCALGLLLARKLGVKWSLAILIASEIVLLIWIRDNLFLNVIMLFIPTEAIKQWQMGG